MGIVGILLAAGLSQRFGKDKLLYPLASGVPVAVASARSLKIVVDHCLAVVNPQATRLAQVLYSEGLDVVRCQRAKTGIGASLACGVAASPEAQAWVIALADMPFIHTTTLQQLVNLLRQGTTIVAPQYQGRRGHPVGFQRQFKPQLMRLSGDVGARGLLQHYPVTLFPCQDAGIHHDIDRQQDIKESKQ